MTAVVASEGRGVMTIELEGAASAVAAALGAIANPEGVNLLILRATLVVLTTSDGAANLSVGIAADAISSATDIINALAMGSLTCPVAYNGHAMQNTAKTEITAPAQWGATKYLTFSGSASTVGLVAKLFLEYIRID